MPRRRRCRWVYSMPQSCLFAPKEGSFQDNITLGIDEYEALRLKDLEGLNQEEAAEKLNVSQPTFHRIIKEARRKVTEAIVHGKQLRIQGGEFKMVGRFGLGGPPSNCICPKCGHKQPKQRGIPCRSMKCPECGTLMVRE